VRTVETHRQNIKRKLDIEGQAELIKVRGGARAPARRLSDRRAKGNAFRPCQPG
jgi:hypothetical protein